MLWLHNLDVFKVLLCMDLSCHIFRSHTLFTYTFIERLLVFVHANLIKHIIKLLLKILLTVAVLVIGTFPLLMVFERKNPVFKIIFTHLHCSLDIINVLVILLISSHFRFGLSDMDHWLLDRAQVLLRENIEAIVSRD